ncbi:valine-tRNA ligase [Sphaceloma murrayae]|uniref:Valine-tRNA ligase n=1 Tax=Sphaceloma murrayae TaxID=2082308 RepID=A0A2K1R129_9PEZI|nr:valine-tRNA ligase [Sphaceloma murrayae]
MDRLMLRISQRLWAYRIFRWTVYSIVGIIVADRIILLTSDYFALVPAEPAMFPHQDIPDSQISVLRDLRYAGEELRNALTPVLLPEDAGESNFTFYDTLLCHIEARRDISHIVLVESNIESALVAISSSVKGRTTPVTKHTIFKGVYGEYGIPLTSEEHTLDLHHNFFSRIARAEAHFQSLKSGRPDTWDEAYTTTMLPPVNATADPETAHALSLDPSQESRAQSLLDRHLRRRNKALKYLRLNPPKPMAWSPQTPDAWDKTRKVDIESGNLHGRKEWKPMYRSWDLERGLFTWEDPDQTEEQAALELEGLQQGNEEYDQWKARKESYLEVLRSRIAS